MSDSTSERWWWWPQATLAAILAGVAGLAAVDLAVDLSAGTTARHAWVEGTTVALAVGAGAWLVTQLVAAARARRQLEHDASALRSSLVASEAAAARWRDEASKWTQGLSQAIDLQLSQWALTGAEKEIALLLLKGLSHKEIAQVRSVEESSVRQQARSIYRKAGLLGRHELAAFFLEDLLAPRPH